MEEFSKALLLWYNINKRPLPWRDTSDPYKIWLSEVILQQTRVEQGMSYYHKFVENYRDVFSLAAAGESEILKLWQGLGYYSRARNLHRAARMVVEQFNGKFPDNYDTLIKLPGVGSYTAAAIASIAYNEPVAAVDGNVKRVVSRLFAITNPIDQSGTIKTIKKITGEIINHELPGEFNQAMMELGASVCIPRIPNCDKCPVAHYCEALSKNIQKDLPVKVRKVKKRTRYFYYFVFLKGNSSMLMRRGANDIWEGLYEFPLIELSGEVPGDKLMKMATDKWGIKTDAIKEIDITHLPKHVLTHQNIYATFVKVLLSEDPLKLVLNINKGALSDYPVSRLTEIYLTQDKKLL